MIFRGILLGQKRISYNAGQNDSNYSRNRIFKQSFFKMSSTQNKVFIDNNLRIGSHPY